MKARTKTARRAHRLLLPGAALLAAGFLFGPGAGADTTSTLAGFNLSGQSVAEQFQLNSPGLLPVGDATTGNIFEVDLPFARTNAASGPEVDAVGSPLYPGDTAAHLGTAVGTFGGPDLPNDPAVAEAQYPPSPSHGSSVTFSSPGASNGPFSVEPGSSVANATSDGATVTSLVGRTALGPAVGSAANLVTVSGSKATNVAHVGSGAVDMASQSSATGVDVAGVIEIAQVVGKASAASDGNTGKPATGLEIGKVTVAGVPAYIDQDGIHLASASTGGSQIGFANGLLENLATLGVTVHVVSPTQTTSGPEADARSGAVEVSLSGHTLSVPGMAPAAPGLPPTPGSPPVPFQINILLGSATAAATASPLPTFPTSPLGDLGTAPGGGAGGSPLPGSPTQMSGGGGVVGAGSLPSSSAPAVEPSTQTLPATGPGSSQQAAGSLGRAELAATGHPVPIGLAVVILLLAVMSSGGLLAYARWQLIDGRRR